MRNFYHFKSSLMAMLFAIGMIAPTFNVESKSCNAKNNGSAIEYFQHDIQLQLSDAQGFPVDGTQFWVTIDVIKQGPLVTLQFPVINFQTGQISTDNPFGPSPFFIPGGFLYTSSGFLPESLRPTDLVNRSFLAASNNGVSEPYSFAQDPSTLPQPPAAYIMQITNAGAIVVQCAGTFGNLIPVGPQTILPPDVTYIVKPTQKLCNNVIIQPRTINTSQFVGSGQLRDSNVNDAFNGIAAFAWTDNSMVEDQTNGTTNAMVAIGSVDANGNLRVGAPVQLTNFGPGVSVFDTAVAINRENPDNIVVSYRPAGAALPYRRIPCRAISNDGGKTWPPAWDGVSTPDPLNGPWPGAPLPGPNDNRGVASDKYGNIWYSLTGVGGDPTTPPNFFVSIDGGVNFNLIYTAPPVINPITDIYDYPQYCFGYDDQGNYGLYFVVIHTDTALFNLFPAVGFIRINGFNSFGPAGTPWTVPLSSPAQVPFAYLTQFTNNMVNAVITAAADGKVWFQGLPNYFSTSYIAPQLVLFKSPGAIDENYAGPWDYTISKNFIGYTSNLGLPSGQISQPKFGYISNSIQSIIYDDQRKALYLIYSQQSPDYSQNMRIPMIISRDNGMTWSDPIEIPTTNFANRGFQTMALDTVTGNLILGWYDGSNDSTYQSVQYFGAVITSSQLDCLVNSIPLSNPLFEVPGPETTLQVLQQVDLASLIKQAEELQKQKILNRKIS